MIISVLQTFFAISIALTLGVSATAQEKEVSYDQKQNDSILYLSEKELVDKTFDLLDKGNDEKAYRKAHVLVNTFKSKRGLYNAYSLLSAYFRKRGIIDSSNYYVHKSLKYNTIADDSLKTRGDLIAYNTLAINYNTKGLYEESKRWYLQGINSSKGFGDKYFYYAFLHGLGKLYTDTKEYKKAISAFEECLTYRNDTEIVMGSLINLGNLYGSLKDFEKSNNYLYQAKKISETIIRPSATAVILNNLGLNLVEQNKIDEGFKLVLESIEIAEKNDNIHLALTFRIDLGYLYMIQGLLKDAELMYSLAAFNAIELGYFNEQLTCYEKLQYLAVEQGSYKKAYNFAQRHASLKDSINNLQKDKEIQELEVKFQTLQKEKEIKLLQTENINRKLDLKNQQEEIKNLVLQQQISQKENENKILNYQNASQKRLNQIALLKKDQEIQQERLKNQVTKNARQKSINLIILYSFLILLIPIIALLVTYYQKVQTQKELSNKQEEINKQKIDALLKDKELEIIKTSIDAQDKERKRIAQELHDSIGGNLAAIKLQLNSFKKPGAICHVRAINRQIDDTYERVRSLSHNLMPKKFRYNQFSDVVQEYLTNIGKASNITTNFSAYPSQEINNLSNVQQEEIFKILQELITNTIKHAQATTVELQMNLIEDVLNIMYEDNGIGFKTENIQEGIGLRNIRSRLRKIEGNLDVDSRINRGSIFNIEIVHTKTTTNEMSHTG